MEIRSSGVGDVLYGGVLCGMLGSRRTGPGGSNEEIAGGGGGHLSTLIERPAE